ncbi:MAG: acetyl ornithine aminotransferase family protein [Chloroflexi bacterium]|nr:MAG: acetyl ornithine aminotransferase family protein [Chloroflexota bacterium]
MNGDKPIPGPRAREWVERDKRAISPSYTRAYPFVMERGKGVEVWDVDGNRYLDFNAGVAVLATGHCHPEVVKAIKEQAEKFIHMAGTDFYYPVQIRLAEKLNEIAPIKEDTLVFFVNSGAEAVESAFKLARYATRRPLTLAFIGAFHGRTMGAITLTASKAVQKRGFYPMVPGVVHVPYAYCYRCAFKQEYPSCDLYCVKYIEEVVFHTYAPGDEFSAIFVEPIQGEGGYVVPPPEFFPRLRELADKYGILLVVDEIQSGMGRTGKMFAIEHWGVEPDIVCVAKGIASGLPLGAMVARKSLMTWPSGAHGNTFGGNPISCAAALVTIKLLEEELIENAARMGEYAMNRLKEMAEKHPIIGDVRGKGLMIGVELVKDRETREAIPEVRDQAVYKAFERGLLLLGCGLSTVRMMPPLSITKDLLDEGLDIFEGVLADIEEELF